MTQSGLEKRETEFDKRLELLKSLEEELTEAIPLVFERNSNMYISDLFLLGAMRRTLSQSKGFRNLIKSRNFPCAAAIVRLQIDTAMRVHGLSLINNIDDFCQKLMAGTQFNKMKSRDNKLLSDAYLREQLARKVSWISDVYVKTSSFIHLSTDHLWSSVIEMDEATGHVSFLIGDRDAERPDEAYFEALEGFYKATKLAGSLILQCLEARPHLDEPLTSKPD